MSHNVDRPWIHHSRLIFSSIRRASLVLRDNKRSGDLFAVYVFSTGRLRCQGLPTWEPQCTPERD